MTDKELLNKRFYPAIQEMYEKSQTIFPKEELPDGFTLSFENLSKFAPYSNEEKTKRQFPIDLFYIDEGVEKEIRDHSVKGLHGFYVFPYRSEITYSDEEIQKMKDKLAEIKAKNPDTNDWPVWDYEEKIKYNDEFKRRNKLFDEYLKETEPMYEKLRKKEISRKDYNKEMKAIYKKYGCVKRCRDAEKIQWELFDYGPNTSEEFFQAAKLAYEGKPYKYKHDNQRVEEAVKMAREFVNNIKNNTPTWTQKNGEKNL